MRLRESGDLEGALRAGRMAVKLAPNAPIFRYGLGTTLLFAGDYGAGFPLFEARLEAPSLRVKQPDLPFPKWRGEPVAGRRILLWGEQGYGDEIQFSRFAAEVRALGADVTLTCAPEVASLLADAVPATVVARSQNMEFSRPDAWAMLGSVPALLGTTRDTVPPPTPIAARPGGRHAVGLAWRGSPSHVHDKTRSLPQGVASALLRDLPDAVSLDLADTGATTFAETAAIIAGLDLVITVDTSVAHLAGSMGKPVWILLANRGIDWRWGLGHADTPWYPSARLIRQPPGQDWAQAVRNLPDLAREALAAQ